MEPVLAGRMLGEFVVADKLGEGGFGEVYRALQPSLGRDAVVKVMRADGRATPQRFLREAQLAAQLDHPYAAHVYAFGAEDDGLLWIAMELVRGTPLSRMLALHGPLPLDRFVPLFERLCEVVHAAHERGIIHRDLKPSNVVVVAHAGRLVPKLIDLGIAGYARLADADPRRPRHATGPLDATAETLDAPGGSAVIGTLTQTGQLLGSPLYMAPEQWSDPTRLDIRSDIYALGVVAFECLSGHPPFVAPDRDELERLHFEEPPPELPGALPRALSRELARALAKDPAARPSSALELAAAVRAASGLGVPQVELPKLPRALLDRVLAASPRPIADAVAAVDSAISMRELRVALDLATRAIVRFIGVLAIAGRANLPSLEGLERARTTLDELARRRISDEVWLRLAIDLCIPLLDEREAFPVPELIDVLAGIGPGRSTLAVLASERAIARDDEAERRALAQGLRDLATLLDALQFLDGYALSDGARVWRGVARSDTPTGRSTRMRLLGSDGEALVAFGPLIQITESMPGAGLEVFVFDGRGPRGALLKDARGHELADDEVWSYLGHLLPSEVHERSAVMDESPYPGLAPFRFEQADRFFGRDAELAKFRNRLRTSPILTIVGASGSGKSSFVLAGIAPDIVSEWHTIVLRPGADPLAALIGAVEEWGHAELESRVPTAVGGYLRRRLTADVRESAGDGRGLLIVIDQLEELFTTCRDPERREAFARAVDGAVRSAADPIRIVLTIRDDFLARTQELPGLRERIGEGLFLLSTPSADHLRRALVEPCRRAGYEIDPELPGRIVSELEGRAVALPLLAFVAARLWERRDPSFRLLRTSSYDAMGGVRGALVKHAEDVWDALGTGAQRQARALFRGLMTSAGTRAALARADAIRIAGDDEVGERVVETLITARLLAARDAEDGEQVEIVHEALLSEWPRLAAWLEDDRVDARLRDQVRDAAQTWHARGRPVGLLWSGDALRDLERWLSSAPRDLLGAEQDFVGTSRRRARTLLRRRRAVATLAAMFVAATMVVVTMAWGRASQERGRAETLQDHVQAQRAHALFERGRRAILAGDSQSAAVDLVRSIELGRDTPGARLMIADALRELRATTHVLRGHTDQVWGVAVSPDGTRIATASNDRSVRLWSATGDHLATLKGGPAADGLVFGRDGRWLAAPDSEGRVWLSHVESRTSTALSSGTRQASVAFSDDGGLVATANVDGTVRLWSLPERTLAREVAGLEPGRDGAWVEFAGQLLVAGNDRSSRVVIADVATGRVRSTIDTRSELRALAIVGPTLVTAGTDHVVRTWRIADGEMLGELRGHRDRISTIAASRDGARVVTASHDGTARVWELATAKLISICRGTSLASSAVFSPDARRVAMTGLEGARICDAATGIELARLTGHDAKIWRLAFIDEESLVTASWDRTARIWSTASQRLIAERRRAPPLPEWAIPLSVDPTQTRFAVGGKGVLVVARDGAESSWLDGHTITAVAWTSRGELAAGEADGTISLRTGGGDVHTAKLPSGGAIETLAFAPDAAHLIAAESSGALWLLEAPRLAILERLGDAGVYAPVIWLGVDAFAFGDRGRVVTRRQGATTTHELGSEVTALSIAPDGGLVAGSFAGRVVTFGSELVFTSHAGPIGRIVAGSTGILTASYDGLARWRGSGPTQVLRGHGAAILDAAIDGANIGWTAGHDGDLRAWELAHGAELAIIRAHEGGVHRLANFGDRNITVGADQVVRIWRAELETRPPSAIQRELACRSRWALDADDVLSERREVCALSGSELAQ